MTGSWQRAPMPCPRRERSIQQLCSLCLRLHFLSKLIIRVPHLALDHRSVWGNSPGRRPTEFISWKWKESQLPPPGIIRANHSTPRIKLLVWARHAGGEIIPLLLILAPPNPNLSCNRAKLCWGGPHFKTLSSLAFGISVPPNAVREGPSTQKNLPPVSDEVANVDFKDKKCFFIRKHDPYRASTTFG